MGQGFSVGNWIAGLTSGTAVVVYDWDRRPIETRQGIWAAKGAVATGCFRWTQYRLIRTQRIATRRVWRTQGQILGDGYSNLVEMACNRARRRRNSQEQERDKAEHAGKLGMPQVEDWRERKREINNAKYSLHILFLPRITAKRHSPCSSLEIEIFEFDCAGAILMV